MLASRGLDAAAATAASTGLLGRAVANQSAVMTFDKAFIAVSLVFVVAAPLLIGVKLALGRRAGSATLRSRGGEDP